jgi:hypothetical protein
MNSTDTEQRQTATGARSARSFSDLLAGIWRWVIDHRVVVLAILATLAGTLIAVRDRRYVLYDDAAITMRYAWRIAAGDGWTYNDGDRTNGASAPLYTMILALCRLVGLDLVQSAKVIGIACYGLCIGLVSLIASRIAGLLAGIVAVTFLIVSVGFRTQSLSGMESILAVVLGLAFILALMEGKDVLAAVLLALAILNKLDAGMLALAGFGAWTLVLRRPPWKLAGLVAAIVAPWILFSWIYFGSPVPFSMTQKLSAGSGDPTSSKNFWWIFQTLRDTATLPMVFFALAAVVAIPAVFRRSPRLAAGLAVCVAWPLMHAVVFSVLDLGDPYPWYVTVLYPPVAVAAACAAVLAVRNAAMVSRWFQFAALAAIVAVVIGLGTWHWGNTGTLVSVLRHGHSVDQYEAFERTRMEAGQYLDEVAATGDVIATCFGWIAYEAEDNPIKETCPLNTRKDVGPPLWTVNVAYTPGSTPVMTPIPSALLVATFSSNAGVSGVFRFTDVGG